MSPRRRQKQDRYEQFHLKRFEDLSQLAQPSSDRSEDEQNVSMQDPTLMPSSRKVITCPLTSSSACYSPPPCSVCSCDRRRNKSNLEPTLRRWKCARPNRRLRRSGFDGDHWCRHAK